MQEQWIKWTPIAGLKPRYDFYLISDEYDGLFIVLQEIDTDKKLRVAFDGLVESYRSTYETNRLVLIHELSQKYSTEWTFFKVENSSYIAWLSQQSCGITDRIGVSHFVFLTNDYVIEVVASYEPTFKELSD